MLSKTFLNLIWWVLYPKSIDVNVTALQKSSQAPLWLYVYWDMSFIELDKNDFIIRGHLCENRSGLDLVITSQVDWFKVFIWRMAETGKVNSGFPQWQVKLFSTASSDFCYSTLVLWSTRTSMSPWVISLTATKSCTILYCKTKHFQEKLLVFWLSTDVY